MKTYYVYIMSSINQTLYVGITNNLFRRVFEHRMKLNEGFTEKYQIYKLVYAEYYTNVQEAIRREKQIKKWRREKKIKLIEKDNPDWVDLARN